MNEERSLDLLDEVERIVPCDLLLGRAKIFGGLILDVVVALLGVGERLWKTIVGLL